MILKLSSTAEIAVKPTESFASFDISKESLQSIAENFPEGIDFDLNTDLVPVAFPLLVANHFNKNGESVNSEAAVRIADTLMHKFTDIDHDRKQVVGHIVGTSFSEFGNDHKAITREEALASEDPFNVVCYAVVYDKVNPQFAKQLRSYANEDSPDYKKWSASWEVSYNDFDIALGSGNLKDVEVIKGKEAYSYAKHLKKNKGSGYDEQGREVRRVIHGNVLGLAAGFTTRPAAAVRGVAIADFDVEELEDEKINSHSSETDVRNNRNNIDMDEKILEKLQELISRVAPQESLANINTFFAEEIKSKNAEWLQRKADLEAAKITAESEAQAQKDLVQSTAANLQTALDEIKVLKEAAAQSLANELFNSRMAEVDSKFEIKDGARSFIAAEIGALDSQESSFASYLEKMGVLLPAKEVKESVASEEVDALVQAEIAKRIPQLAEKTKLSEEEVKTLLSTASEISPEIPNASQGGKESLRDKFKGSFAKENVTISYNKR